MMLACVNISVESGVQPCLLLPDANVCTFRLVHLVIIDHDNVSLNLNSVVCNVVVYYYMFMSCLWLTFPVL